MDAVRQLPFFLASFAWNYGLGMTWLAVPLHAHRQGLGAAQIGILFSLPVVAQIVLYALGVLALGTAATVALLRRWAFSGARLAS